jgi:hypothetical protein
MDPTTKDKRDRIGRIQEVHPYATETQVRAILVAHYGKVSRDPTTGGPDGIQVQMEALVDVVCRMNEYDFKNHLARTAEQFEVTWDEMTDLMEDDDK